MSFIIVVHVLLCDFIHDFVVYLTYYKQQYNSKYLFMSTMMLMIQIFIFIK